MPDPKSPREPDADAPPIPNAPKDSSVYGGNWGGEIKKPGAPPPDRPDRIKAPSEAEGDAEP